MLCFISLTYQCLSEGPFFLCTCASTSCLSRPVLPSSPLPSNRILHTVTIILVEKKHYSTVTDRKTTTHRCASENNRVFPIFTPRDSFYHLQYEALQSQVEINGQRFTFTFHILCVCVCVCVCLSLLNML